MGHKSDLNLMSMASCGQILGKRKTWWKDVMFSVWVVDCSLSSVSLQEDEQKLVQGTDSVRWCVWRLATAWNNYNVCLKIDQMFLTHTLNNNYVWLQRCWLIVYDNHLMVNIHIKPSSLTSFTGFIYPIYTMKVGMRERR